MLSFNSHKSMGHSAANELVKNIPVPVVIIYEVVNYFVIYVTGGETVLSTF